MIGALSIGTVILLFGWIPFWWIIAAISLYRMNRHDEQNGHSDQTGDPV